MVLWSLWSLWYMPSPNAEHINVGNAIFKCECNCFSCASPPMSESALSAIVKMKVIDALYCVGPACVQDCLWRLFCCILSPLTSTRLIIGARLPE